MYPLIRISATSTVLGPTLSVDGSVVYVGGDDKRVYALKAADGSILWSTGVQAPLVGSPVLDPVGTCLYVADDAGHVNVLRVSDGKFMWKYLHLKGKMLVTPVVLPDGRALMTGGKDHMFYALKLYADRPATLKCDAASESVLRAARYPHT